MRKKIAKQMNPAMKAKGYDARFSVWTPEGKLGLEKL